jgi:hypothetical protein
MAKKGHKASTLKIPIKADEQHTTSLPFLRLKTQGSRSSLPSSCPGIFNLSSSKEFESWRASCDFLVVSHSGDHTVPNASLLGLLLWSLVSQFRHLGIQSSGRSRAQCSLTTSSRVRSREVRAHRRELLVSPGCSSSTS